MISIFIAGFLIAIGSVIGFIVINKLEDMHADKNKN